MNSSASSTGFVPATQVGTGRSSSRRRDAVDDTASVTANGRNRVLATGHSNRRTTPQPAQTAGASLTASQSIPSLGRRAELTKAATTQRFARGGGGQPKQHGPEDMSVRSADMRGEMGKDVEWVPFKETQVLRNTRADLMRIRDAMQKHAYSRFKNVRALMGLFDRDLDGKISMDDWLHGIQAANFPINESDAKKLFTGIDINGDNGLSYAEMVRVFEPMTHTSFAEKQALGLEDLKGFLNFTTTQAEHFHKEAAKDTEFLRAYHSAIRANETPPDVADFHQSRQFRGYLAPVSDRDELRSADSWSRTKIQSRDDELQRVRDKVERALTKSKGAGGGGMSGKILTAFRHLDKQGRGYITEPEFRKLIGEDGLNLGLNKRQTDLVAEWCTDEAGAVEGAHLAEFLNTTFLPPKMHDAQHSREQMMTALQQRTADNPAETRKFEQTWGGLTRPITQEQRSEAPPSTAGSRDSAHHPLGRTYDPSRTESKYDGEGGSVMSGRSVRPEDTVPGVGGIPLHPQLIAQLKSSSAVLQSELKQEMLEHQTHQKLQKHFQDLQRSMTDTNTMDPSSTGKVLQGRQATATSNASLRDTAQAGRRALATGESTASAPVLPLMHSVTGTRSVRRQARHKQGGGTGFVPHGALAAAAAKPKEMSSTHLQRAAIQPTGAAALGADRGTTPVSFVSEEMGAHPRRNIVHPDAPGGFGVSAINVQGASRPTRDTTPLIPSAVGDIKPVPAPNTRIEGRKTIAGGARTTYDPLKSYRSYEQTGTRTHGGPGGMARMGARTPDSARSGRSRYSVDTAEVGRARGRLRQVRREKLSAGAAAVIGELEDRLSFKRPAVQPKLSGGPSGRTGDIFEASSTSAARPDRHEQFYRKSQAPAPQLSVKLHEGSFAATRPAFDPWASNNEDKQRKMNHTVARLERSRQNQERIRATYAREQAVEEEKARRRVVAKSQQQLRYFGAVWAGADPGAL